MVVGIWGGEGEGGRGGLVGFVPFRYAYDGHPCDKQRESLNKVFIELIG